MNRPVLMALALNLVLGAAVAAEFAGRGAGEDGTTTATRVPAVPEPGRAPAPAVDHTREWVGTILARPLFYPERRPQTVAVSAAAPAANPGLPRLAGILVTPSGARAIFAMPEGAKPVTVGPGAQVGPWTVQRIDARAVTVAGPDGSRDLHVAFENPLAGPVPTLAADAPPGPFGQLPGRPINLHPRQTRQGPDSE